LIASVGALLMITGSRFLWRAKDEPLLLRTDADATAQQQRRVARRMTLLCAVLLLALAVPVVVVYATDHVEAGPVPSGDYSACADGDMAACDRLYFDSDVGSDAESFGSTCGDRYSPQSGDCEANHGGPVPSGDYSACADGDMAACDRLYFDSDVGSDAESFGSTCGDRYSPQSGDCEANYRN
jgi:hypothetical protein